MKRGKGWGLKGERGGEWGGAVQGGAESSASFCGHVSNYQSL